MDVDEPRNKAVIDTRFGPSSAPHVDMRQTRMNSNFNIPKRLSSRPYCTEIFLSSIFLVNGPKMYIPGSEAALSQETLISLQQLDPSPIDSPLDLDKQLPDLPPPSPPRRAATLGLGGNGHGAVYYCKYLLPSI
jgi:hypothetical protein